MCCGGCGGRVAQCGRGARACRRPGVQACMPLLWGQAAARAVGLCALRARLLPHLELNVLPHFLERLRDEGRHAPLLLVSGRSPLPPACVAGWWVHACVGQANSARASRTHGSACTSICKGISPIHPIHPPCHRARHNRAPVRPPAHGAQVGAGARSCARVRAAACARLQGDAGEEVHGSGLRGLPVLASPRT